MNKISTGLFSILIAFQSFALTIEPEYEIDPKTEKLWVNNVNHLLKNYYPFKTEVIGQDFNRIKEKDEPVKTVLKDFFILGTDYQKELSKDPVVKKMEYNVEFFVVGDISSFEFQPAHTNLNCYELFELVAKKTTNSFGYRFDTRRGRIRYEIK